MRYRQRVVYEDFSEFFLLLPKLQKKIKLIYKNDLNRKNRTTFYFIINDFIFSINVFKQIVETIKEYLDKIQGDPNGVHEMKLIQKLMSNIGAKELETEIEKHRFLVALYFFDENLIKEIRYLGIFTLHSPRYLANSNKCPNYWDNTLKDFPDLYIKLNFEPFSLKFSTNDDDDYGIVSLFFIGTSTKKNIDFEILKKKEKDNIFYEIAEEPKEYIEVVEKK